MIREPRIRRALIGRSPSEGMFGATAIPAPTLFLLLRAATG
jgi:hypothetical protein